MRNGFRGRIYATKPTAELCSIMLRDSAHIQEFEAEWKNRKGQRSGAEPVEPMYTIQDAEAAIALFRGFDYNKEVELAPGLVIRFVDVGHLLGSSSIEIWVTENGATTKLVFSGDIGNLHQPIIKDPTYLKDADYVFMESTYGDRCHGPKPDYVGELAKILQRIHAARRLYCAGGRKRELVFYHPETSFFDSADAFPAGALLPSHPAGTKMPSGSRAQLTTIACHFRLFLCHMVASCRCEVNRFCEIVGNLCENAQKIALCPPVAGKKTARAVCVHIGSGRGHLIRFYCGRGILLICPTCRKGR